MNFKRLSEVLDAYCTVMPSLSDQELFDVRIDATEGVIKITLEKDVVRIKVT